MIGPGWKLHTHMRMQDEERVSHYQMKRRTCRGDRVITTAKMAMAPASRHGLAGAGSRAAMQKG